MSDLLAFIRLQSSKKNDDYDVLRSTIHYADNMSMKHKQKTKKITTKSSIKNMKGGDFSIKLEDARNLLQNFNTFTEGAAEYDKIGVAYNKINKLSSAPSDTMIQINGYNSREEFEEAIGNLQMTSPKEVSNENEAAQEPDVSMESRSMTDVPAADLIDTPPKKRETESKPLVQPKPFDILKKGSILFHPSQDIKQFGDSVIFVNLPDVLDKNKQRSFVMFFTPNEEYARRYSGMWSLNKRPVYVHKFSVENDITGIKELDPKLIPDSLENRQLAHGMCGPTEDGFINGIKIKQPIDNTDENKSVAEYYICNPEIYLKHEGTWMQFGSTEWVEISNKKQIFVPDKTPLQGSEGLEGQVVPSYEGLARKQIENEGNVDEGDEEGEGNEGFDDEENDDGTEEGEEGDE
jgi:uncharacterized protein YegP (UPF0339 family)